MGEDPDWDVDDIIPDKWYCLSMDSFQDGSGKTGCDQTFVDTKTCCQLGAAITAWLDADLECVRGRELCIFTGYTAQKLKNMKGPYDSQAECFADCP